MYLRTLKAAQKNFGRKFSCQNLSSEEFYIFFHLDLGGGGCLYFPLKHKSAMYTFVQQRGGGSRRDPNHKSMYKCAYMYVHLSLSPPVPKGLSPVAKSKPAIQNEKHLAKISKKLTQQCPELKFSIDLGDA